MTEIVEAARAKVNLALHVLGRRADGYHELSSVVAFADVADRLSIVPANADKCEISGPFSDLVPQGQDNIIWKAKAWLAQRVDVPALAVKLEKNIPVAAGLGGGSADAAAMLRAMLRLSGKVLSRDEVSSLATALGADVPVCFEGVACRMEGIGEKTQALDVKLPAAIVLVNPRLECSTADVFRAMKLAPGQSHNGGNDAWRNDMLAAAAEVQPQIHDVLQALGGHGFERVSMSGSGATCFGLTGNFAAAEVAARRIAEAKPQWWVRAARLG